MKKDEKTKKKNTAESMEEEKNSPEHGKEERKEQPARSNINNSESSPENLSKSNHSFVRISGKKIAFTFFLILAVVAAGFGYVYRDQVKKVLPNSIVEFFTDSFQIPNIDTQESTQNEIGIDEIEKKEINSDISELSIERSTLDQDGFNASDQHETDSSYPLVDEAHDSKHKKLEDDEISHSEKVFNKEARLDISKNYEQTLQVGNPGLLAIVKELHKITVEIEAIEFTKNFPVKDNPALTADHTDNKTFSEKLLESLKGLIQIRKIKDYEDLSLSQERENSLKNQFIMNLISSKTMLITGLNAEALDDIRRAKKILNLIYDVDKENVTMMIGRLDEIIYQVKEMD